MSAADPGGIFASDAHRRVMANLPNPDGDPMSVEELIRDRINEDDFALAHLQSIEEVEDVLADLEADGFASESQKGWKNTKAGFEALTGPPDESTITEQESPAQIGLGPSKGASG